MRPASLFSTVQARFLAPKIICSRAVRHILSAATSQARARRLSAAIMPYWSFQPVFIPRSCRVGTADHRLHALFALDPFVAAAIFHPSRVYACAPTPVPKFRWPHCSALSYAARHRCVR